VLGSVALNVKHYVSDVIFSEHSVYTMGGKNVSGTVVLHCNGRTYGNSQLITYRVGTLCTHTCSINPSIAGSTGGKLLMESSGVRSSYSISCPPWLRNMCP
jgi:hypothetical protein